MKLFQGVDAARIARLLFWLAALFSLVMALLPHPPHVPGNPSDKVQHAIAFATLGLLGGFGYRGTSILRLLIGLSLFGAFIEIAQLIPVLHRDSDPLDWLTDTIAAALGLLIVRWWARYRR